jgi:hypothetical protein
MEAPIFIPEVIETVEEETPVETPVIVDENVAVTVPEAKPMIIEAQESFYQRLLEQIGSLQTAQAVAPQPVSVIVETTEAHVEKLFEIENSMLSILNGCVSFVKTDLTEMHGYLKEEITSNREVINKIVETQQKIIAAQDVMVGVIVKLVEKISDIAVNPISVNPIVNVPAPIVNITEGNNSRRVTKLVQRNKEGLITKVIEDSSSDEV